jgi:hypothetical protein
VTQPPGYAELPEAITVPATAPPTNIGITGTSA